MRNFLIAFLLTAFVAAAVVYTFGSAPEQHTENPQARNPG